MYTQQDVVSLSMCLVPLPADDDTATAPASVFRLFVHFPWVCHFSFHLSCRVFLLQFRFYSEFFISYDTYGFGWWKCGRHFLLFELGIPPRTNIIGMSLEICQFIFVSLAETAYTILEFHLIWAWIEFIEKLEQFTHRRFLSAQRYFWSANRSQ